MICTASVLLLFLIGTVNSQVDVEMGYLRLAKKMVRFEITGYENVDNLNAKGECCSGVFRNNVCAPCTSRIRYHRYDKGNIMKLFEIGIFTNNSRGTFYSTKLFNINPDEHLFFQIIHTENNRGELMDVWSNYSTTLVGSYVMNGVWGIYGNTLLYYNIEILPTNSYSSYYSVTFRIYRVEWIKKEFSDGTCCQVINSTGCDNACPFYINVYSNDNLAFATIPSTYNLNISRHFVKASSGSTSTALQQETVRLRLDILGYPNNKKIDEIRINNIQAIPNRNYEFNDLSGSLGKIRMDVNLKYECRGFRGINCRFFCSDDTKNIDCHFERGTRFCANGASDFPTCTTFGNTCGASPCVNGGICSPLPSGFNCLCPPGYKGKYCEEPNCESECRNGNCVRNTCVCDAGYEGPLCDTTNCPSSTLNMCKNRGVCKIVKGVQMCVCPPNSRGPTCEEPVCASTCQVGTCSFEPNSNPIKAVCVCANGFTGDACDIRPLKLVFSSDTLKIILISLFSITFVISAKLFLMMLFVKFETSVEFRDKKVSEDPTNNRPSSLAGL